MRYYVEVTCRDCTGQDYQGCGGGYPWDLNDGEGYATREAALDAIDADQGPPWDWTIQVREC
jgi:hypothetical protein